MPCEHRDVALADLQPGMCLGNAVHDERGNILLPAGTSLTPPLIVALQRRDLECVSIIEENIGGHEPMDAAMRQRISERIDFLFRKIPTDADSGLMRIIRQHRGLGGNDE